MLNPKSALCPMIIEQPGNLTIRAKTRYDLSNQRPSQAPWTTIEHFDPVREVFAQANKSYSYTSQNRSWHYVRPSLWKNSNFFELSWHYDCGRFHCGFL